MWDNRKFEERMRVALTLEFGKTEGQTIFGQYTGARKILLDDVYDEIRGAEPSLTDHGPNHIGNVLDNVDRLLPSDQNYFNAIELYVLGLAVLFHDVGNLEGREGHNKRIAKYYDVARPGKPEQNVNEKRLVVAAAQAHTGMSRSGSLDTLVDVPDAEHLGGTRVRLCEIATLVRFADELAEGVQRTSLFLQAEKKYTRDSMVHHRYASVTNVAIDRGLRRIALTYNVILESLGDNLEERLEEFSVLLQYIYRRITKLEEERKYARFYCPDLLLAFRETTVRIEVVAEGEFLELEIEPIVLSDKVIPEGRSDLLPKIDHAYDPATVLDRIRSELEKRTSDSPPTSNSPTNTSTSSAEDPVAQDKEKAGSDPQPGGGKTDIPPTPTGGQT